MGGLEILRIGLWENFFDQSGVDDLPCSVNYKFPNRSGGGAWGDPERTWTYIGKEGGGFLDFSIGDPLV